MWLAVVISADNISGGFAATAFVAYLSSLTNKAYTATQYALFSSLMTLPGKVISGFSGIVVDAEGYLTFFIVAAGLGLPAIVLVVILMRRNEDPKETRQRLACRRLSREFAYRSRPLASCREAFVLGAPSACLAG